MQKTQTLDALAVVPKMDESPTQPTKHTRVEVIAADRTETPQERITQESPILDFKKMRSRVKNQEVRERLKELKAIEDSISDLILNLRLMRHINKDAEKAKLINIISDLENIFIKNTDSRTSLFESDEQTVIQQMNDLLLSFRETLEFSVVASTNLHKSSVSKSINKFFEEINFEHSVTQRDFLMNFYIVYIKDMLSAVLDSFNINNKADGKITLPSLMDSYMQTFNSLIGQGYVFE